MKNIFFYKCLATFFLAFSLFQASYSKKPAASCSFKSGFSGFYVGGVAGYDLTEDHFSQIVREIGGDGDTSIKTSLKSFAGGAVAGWGKEFSGNFYAGAELSYLLGSSKVTGLEDYQGYPVINLKKKDAVTVAARLGILLNQRTALPYIKVGYATSKFQTSSEDTNGKPLQANQRLNGFSLGGGVDLKLTSRMVLGLGYTYIRYNHWKRFHPINDATPLDEDEYIEINRKPKSHNLVLRAVYLF